MDKITITNFRKIKETWEFDLAPITFFTGTNNSGKSNVLKALMLLSDFADSQNHLNLAFNGKNYRKHKIDCYYNSVNRDNFKNNKYNITIGYLNKGYSIEIKFSPLIIESNTKKFANGKVSSLLIIRDIDGATFEMTRVGGDEYQLKVDSKLLETRNSGTPEIELKDLKQILNKTNDEITKLEFELSSLNKSHPKAISIRQNIQKRKINISEIEKRIKSLQRKSKIDKDTLIFSPVFNLNDFQNSDLDIGQILRRILPRYFKEEENKLGKTDSIREMFRLMQLGDQLLDAISFSIDHLSPHRNSQTRLYVNDETSSDIYELINIHAKYPIDKRTRGGAFIKIWMKEFDIGEDYRIRDVEGMASIVEVEEKNEWINLVDKGFGAGQIFTILLKIALCINYKHLGKNPTKKSFRFRKTTQLILIEEPEANLHPALQSKLAELFHHAYNAYGIRFIIETHSEYILRSSQLIVNKIIKDDSNAIIPFGVYYFDKIKGPYKMEFDSEGKFINDFGTGFFDVSRKLSRKFL
ncbi:MAG: AAA family ATPase [Bacteroidetes bacterium]|nr:AAA family ATPase [Bacteroidota bacterium]